jgi:hypothetical protein
MRERDGTQLPLVETFGEDLERAIAKRTRSPRRSQRRVLSVVGAAALVGASLLTSPGRAASGVVGEWLGLAEPGGPPTVDGPRQRGELHKEPTDSIVLATGRAPDGVRYEFVLESFSSDPPYERFRHCLNLEWPDAARAGQISPQRCYTEFPPAAVEEAVVQRGGAMFDTTQTTHIQIAGLARSDVSEVRILYKDEHGAKRDAPFDLVRVTGALGERAGANAPFSVFIGFLPQAWLGYGAVFDPRQCPPEDHPYDTEAMEVIAYDDQGEAIATETGDNGISVGGRAPCG